MSAISGDSPRSPVDPFAVDDEAWAPLAPSTGTLKALVDVLADVGCAAAANGAGKLAAKAGCGTAVPAINACAVPVTQAVKEVAHRAIDKTKMS